MSERSDEELVGDVDMDFDLQETKSNTTKPDTKAVKPKEKSVVLSKTSLKKKTAIKASLVQDDLLQAFTFGAKSVKQVTKTESHSKKKISDVKDKSNPSKIVADVKGKSIPSKIVADVKGKSFPSKISEGVGKYPTAESGKREEVIKSSESEKIKEDIVRPSDKIDVKEEKVKLSEKNKDEVIKKSENIEIKKENIDTLEKNKIKGEAIKKSENIEIKKENIDTLEKNKIKEEIRTPSEGKQREKTENVNEKKKAEIEIVNESCKRNQSNTRKIISDKPLCSMKADSGKAPEQKVKDETITSAKSNKTSDAKSVTDKSATRDLKRKAGDNTEKTSSAKVAKTDPVSTEVKENKDAKLTTEIPMERFSEDDYKSMDNYLADQMVVKIRDNVKSKSGVKYIVKVSPFEIGDLAYPSVQQLIQLHPNMALVFKHQSVKFRKKKGFAEAIFSTMTELKEFVYQLTQIKVFEKRIEVTITALNQDDVLTFVIHLNRNGKLLSLLNSGEDPQINRPVPMGSNMHKVQFEKAPRSTNAAFMHSMFPFTNNVVVTRSEVGKESKPVYHGPVSVFYISPKWMEAVMDCCSDFTVNGFPLVVVGDYIPGKIALPMEEEKKEDKREASSLKERKVEGRQDSDKESERTESTMDVGSGDCGAGVVVDNDNNDNDDPVANMTRDVCEDMLESIQRLKELEPNNPNMDQIILMQNQLSALHSSLWTTPSNKESLTKSDGSELGHVKLTKAERKRQEMKLLEERLEEAQRQELLKEEEIKQQKEKEMQKKRELERKRKSMWAKSTLTDFKKYDGRGSDKISKDAERFLQQREKRLREEEMERKKEEELRQKQEEDMLRLQREEEEKRKEEERKRLIEKIEESRLRDSKKFSSSQLAWNPSSEHRSFSPSSRKERDGSGADQRHQRSDRESTATASRSNRDKDFSDGSRARDGGVEDRLDSFVRELEQQGKLERESPQPRSTVNRSDDQRYSSSGENLIIREEDYDAILNRNELHALPPRGKYFVQLSTLCHRMCPVDGCPAKSNFREKGLLREHWTIFHQAQTTMRFCPRCTAYFMNPVELVTHISKHHSVSSQRATDLMHSARVKVIPNPSYRDPYPFILPPDHQQ